MELDHNSRLWRPPLPELIWPLLLEKAFLGPSERDRCVTALGCRAGAVVQSYLQQQELHYHHQERLYEQCSVESGARVVEYPVQRIVSTRFKEQAHL